MLFSSFPTVDLQILLKILDLTYDLVSLRFKSPALAVSRSILSAVPLNGAFY